MANFGACRRCTASVSDEDRVCPYCGQTDPYRDFHPWELLAYEEVKKGNQSEAVKIVRQHTGLGVAEATYLVKTWLPPE